MGGAARAVRRPAARRPAGDPPRGPRGEHQGGGDRVGRLGLDRRRLLARRAVVVRRSGHDRVLLGVPDRVEPQHRQRVRVGVADELLRRAPEVPAPGAVLGDLRRARDAGDLHLRRDRLDQPLRLDPLRVRRVPAVHRGAHAVHRQPAHRPGQQQIPQVRPTDHPEHGQARRAAPVHRGKRQAAGHPAVRRPPARRVHRRDLRRRQRAGRAGGQPRAVHRLLVERLRHPRPAGAVLPARRHARPLHLPAGGTGDHPRLRRREDDHRRVVPHPDVALAARDRARC